MGGWVTVSSPCLSCGRVFSYNPHRVPSYRIDGERHPICRTCIERANPRRVAGGISPIEILPGAYDPLPESEL